MKYDTWSPSLSRECVEKHEIRRQRRFGGSRRAGRGRLARSFLLGSVSVLIVLGGAQAADLPAKAKAIEYVKVCSPSGAGFYYIPGTDTCLKLGGYLRVDVVANANGVGTGNYAGPGGAQNRYTNGYTWRSREKLSVDTRTATEYGVVRSYFEGVYSWTVGSSAGQGNGSTLYDGGAQNNASNGVVAGGSLGVYYAFIQFAGFTIGKAVSRSSAPWINYPGNIFDGLVGGSGTLTGVNQFAYTAEFGQGISATISAEDPTAYYQAGVLNTNVTSGNSPFGTSDYAGTISPDIVGMVRVDQAWGLFQASVALHNNHAAYYGGTELTGHPQDKWGWAGQLALSIKNIPTGPGDRINIQGVYTNGASRYNFTPDQASQAGAAIIYGGTSLGGAYQSVGYGFAPDTVFGTLPDGTNSSQQLVSTWGFRGAYTHNWDPYWSSSIYGAYAAVSYNGTAKALICGINGAGGSFRTQLNANLSSCNPDYSIGQLGFTTGWTPVKNLTFTADLTYTMLAQKMLGTVNAPSTAIGKPAATYELKDQNTLTLMLRAQRNW